MTHSRGMSGSTCTVWCTPFTSISYFTAVGFLRAKRLSCKKSAAALLRLERATDARHIDHALLADHPRSAPARACPVLLGDGRRTAARWHRGAADPRRPFRDRV